MIKLKAGIITVMAIGFMLLTQSCGKKPFACFRTIPEEDSIHVNQPVIFNSSCTDNGNDFSWQLYDNADSIEFGPTITKTFKDTGTVHVYLLVVSGANTSAFSRDIVVRL